jgi:hypothetical protein
MLSSSEEEAFLPGVMANTQFRTNIGFTGSARRGAPLVIEVAILGAEGATLGTRTFTVPAGAVNHLQFSSAAITTTPFDEGTARVRIVSGDGEVVSYASVVENASNNAIFISSIVPGANGANATSSSFAEKLRSLF